jgi:hypothetical protein
MKFIRVVGLLGVMFCATAVFASKVKTDYDRFDSARLKTFSFKAQWSKGTPVNGPEGVDQLVKHFEKDVRRSEKKEA